MTGVVRGAFDVLRGWRFLLAHPRLWGWVLAPALLTALLIGAIIWAVLSLVDPAIVWTSTQLPSWLAGWVSGVLRTVVVLTLGLAGYVVFVGLATLIAGPFNELLSEAVEARVTGAAPPPFSLSAFVWGVARSIVHALRRLLVYLAGMVLLFVVGALVPVVGTIAAAAVGAYFTARYTAYDLFDAVFGRRGWSYGAKIEWLASHRARSLGVGGATAALMLVPVINLVALGIGATGATLGVLDDERAQQGLGRALR